MATRCTASAAAQNRQVQQHAARFIAHADATAAAERPRVVKDEFDAFLECSILARGFFRLGRSRSASFPIYSRHKPAQGRRRTVIKATGLRQSRSAALKFPMPWMPA